MPFAGLSPANFFLTEKGPCTVLDIWDVFSNLFELFLLIAVCYGVVRLHVLPPSATKMLSSLLMNVTLPATVFTSMVRPFDPAFISSGLLAVALGFGFYLLYAALSALLVRPFRVPQGKQGTWIFAATFSNNGFMGFPIALALFGEEGLALAVFLGIPFNILAYTLGSKLICMDRVTTGDTAPLSWRSILCTMANASTLLGLIFYAARIPVPVILESSLGYLSDVTTPLSMLITGMNLAGGNLVQILRDRDIFSACLLRLLLLPVVAWAILEHLPIQNSLILGVTLIILAMPSPSITALLAEAYDGNTQFAAGAVFLSSLLCLVTIPLISLLL